MLVSAHDSLIGMHSYGLRHHKDVLCMGVSIIFPSLLSSLFQKFIIFSMRCIRDENEVQMMSPT